VLQSLGPAFAQANPEIVLELAPLQNSLKKQLLDKIQAAKNAPPPPDPKVMALQEQAKINAAEAQQDAQLKERDAAMKEQQALREEQRKEREFQQDAMFKRMEAMLDERLKTMETVADIRIQQMKTAAGIAQQAEQHKHRMEMAEDAAARQPTKNEA